MSPRTPNSTAIRLEADVETLGRSLPPAPPPVPRPCLALMCGLPGSGKTHFARILASEVPMQLIESDAARKTLVGIPAYNSDENRRVFSACRRLIQQLLERGIPVLLDATNVTERDRSYSIEAAIAKGAEVIIVKVTAPDELIRNRLRLREQGLSKDGASDAGLETYLKMKARVQPVSGPHFLVDTSRDNADSLKKIVDTITSISGL